MPPPSPLFVYNHLIHSKYSCSACRSLLDYHGRRERAEDPACKPGGECQQMQKYCFSDTDVSPWESMMNEQKASQPI
jgi:hypothetical protein